ncbi:MAG: FlgD immunoglobulin-like domain containing protein, partial [bacterium]
LASDRSVDLAIGVYDLAGRLVRRLHDGPVGSGTTPFAWDGRDSEGRRVAAGMYFVRATGGRQVETAKSVRIH